jgi:hypothetical protein
LGGKPSVIAASHRRSLAGQDFVEIRTDRPARLRLGQRVAAAAAVVGEDLRPGPACDRGRRRAGHAGVATDVGGDVLEVLAGDDPGRHRGGGVVGARPRILDLRCDDPLDRLVVLTRGPRGGEGVVQVGTDLGGRAGLGHLMADAALLNEEHAAPLLVGRARSAAGRGERDRRESGEGEKDAGRVRWLGHGHAARSAPESIRRGRVKRGLSGTAVG